ncbi:MAG: right-handed parallel beta-helix repeat-containing protein [Verrucomicrobiales bacterium]|nr:right-handed parallel beta-helix repeat-containing protein [Verrucomicrobiales bacterium]
MNRPLLIPPVCILALALVAPRIFGQGGLTPPGPPAPTMKTLAQIEPRAPLAALPVTLSNAGSYYLTTNLVGVAGQNGITLAADHVTLDLNGFALLGVTGSLNAIHAPSARRNIVIRNGTIRGWGQTAVALTNSEDCVVEQLHVAANGSGLLVGNRSAVRLCTVVGNTNVAGIAVGHGAVVQDCVVASNAFRGIVAGDRARITRCTVLANATGGNDGIAAGLGALVEHCVAAFNGNIGAGTGGGIAVQEGSTVIGCTTMSNAVEGVFVSFDSVVRDTASRGNGVGISTTGSARIESCTAALNRFLGIWDMGGSLIVNCTAMENAGPGIVATNQSIVRGCQASFNAQEGILIGAASRAENNHCTFNGAAGLRALGADNRIEGNLATDNLIGIQVPGSPNLVVRNQASFNTTNFSVAAGNLFGTVENATSLNTNKNPHANFGF